MSYNVAVVGATGNVGREMLKILAEREFPINNIHAISSERSAGIEVSFGEDKVLKVEALKDFDFKANDIDIVLMSASGDVSKEYAPKAAKAGAVVIDNSSCFRMEKDIPLIVPEVNPEAIEEFSKRNIIANPNCSTIQMLVALKPLHDMAKIKRIVVSTYQAVSGAGMAAMDELFNQVRAIYMNSPITKKHFLKQIAFNVIPQIDIFQKDGNTKEEAKMINETKKILSPEIEVSATCVRVPVFIGHAESVNVSFENKITASEARNLLRKSEGVLVIDKLDEEDGYITPVEIAGDDNVFVSRIRNDASAENSLNMWIVADNLRKGAALNAIQIAELWAKKQN